MEHAWLPERSGIKHHQIQGPVRFRRSHVLRARGTPGMRMAIQLPEIGRSPGPVGAPPTTGVSYRHALSQAYTTLLGWPAGDIPSPRQNREGGSNPPRSRHCERGVFGTMPLRQTVTREGAENVDPRARRPARASRESAFRVRGPPDTPASRSRAIAPVAVPARRGTAAPGSPRPCDAGKGRG